MPVCVHMSCKYLKLPEDAACVSVVVMSERDVLHSAVVAFHVALHVFKEPGFKVQSNSVNLMLKRKKLNMTKSVKHISIHAHKHLTLSGSAWSVMVPVMMTAVSSEYWIPSTNVLSLFSDASAKRLQMFSSPLTGS